MAIHQNCSPNELVLDRYLSENRDLVSKGADINALDRSGDSPLELATSAGEAEAAPFLTEHGAKRVRGDDAQRQKAIEDRVREATG